MMSTTRSKCTWFIRPLVSRQQFTDFVPKSDRSIPDGSGAIVVLAILFELTPDGSTTELLQAVIENIHKVAKPGSVTETGPLSFGELIWHLEASPLYQYSGSLTTPPCAEGVTFYVAKEPMRLDVSTYLALKKVMKFNSRYTQNTPGESNLLEVASSQVVAAKCGMSRRLGFDCDPTVHLMAFAKEASRSHRRRRLSPSLAYTVRLLHVILSFTTKRHLFVSWLQGISETPRMLAVEPRG